MTRTVRADIVADTPDSAAVDDCSAGEAVADAGSVASDAVSDTRAHAACAGDGSNEEDAR